MGIVRMRNVTVIGHLPVMSDVVDALQRAGVVEVLASPYELPSPQLPGAEYALVHSASNLDRARRVTALLERYHVNPQPMATFVTEKFHTSEQRFRELTFDARADDTYRLVTEADDELQHIQEEIAALRETVASLTPWLSYPVPTERWLDSGAVRWFRGTVRAQDPEGVAAALAAVSELVDMEIVAPGDGQELDRVAVAVSAHESVAGDVANALAELGFERTETGRVQGTPADIVAQATDRIAQLEHASTEVEAGLATLAAERYGEMFLLVSALESERDRLEVPAQFAATQQTFIATGWMPAKDEEALRAVLAPWDGLVDVTLTEPDDASQVPVQLENPSWLQPFELLTDLYGRPRYGEVDPTPLIAPFFTLFVALCIGDVGYGLMLVAAMHLISTRLHVAPGVKRFTALVMYGGWMSVPVGVAFGSYLALPYDYLPTVLQRLRIIDPLNEVVVLLGFTLALGAIQVVLGITVAAWAAFRRGDPETAVGSHLSILLLLACIAAYALTSAQYPVLLGAGIVVTVLLQGRALSVALQPSDRPLWDRALGFLWLAAVLVLAVSFGIDGMVTPALWALVLLTAVGASISHTARRALLATLGGAYAVYGLTGILNDTLSYTRLAALGLSSALVGMVFNIMAEMVWQPAAAFFASGGWGLLAGGITAVFAAAVFTVGHVFNVTVNLLGAFVHPMRLQFVEFFGKFYEAGNRPFQPLRYRKDRIVFSAGESGEKGGVS